MQEKVTLHLINDLDDESVKTCNDINDNLSLRKKVDKAVHIYDLNSINRLFLGAEEVKGALSKAQGTEENNLPNISSIIQASSSAGYTKEIVIPYFRAGGQEMRN